MKIKLLQLLKLFFTLLVVTIFINCGTGESKQGRNQIEACLITKTEDNPFFAKMREGAQAEADKLGVKLSTYAGKSEDDNESQVMAIKACIAAKVKGILITPANSQAIVPDVIKARDAGILVITLDTPLEPIDAADATFATDNFKAGELIGEWARKKLGPAANNAKIALLNLNVFEISVDVARDQGFLRGFGINLNDPSDIGDENDPRIVGNDVTEGHEEGGRKAMENLLRKDPNINVVYTINELSAIGAYQALKAAGKEKDVLIVSVDGGCEGVKNVEEGIIDATAMQFPLRMASLGIAGIVKFALSGEKPKVNPILKFFNTGVELITDEPVSGLDSKTSKVGLTQCWG